MADWKPISTAPMDELIEGRKNVDGLIVTARIAWVPDFDGGRFVEGASLEDGWEEWRELEVREV